MSHKQRAGGRHRDMGGHADCKRAARDSWTPASPRVLAAPPQASNGVRRFCLKCGTPLSFQVRPAVALPLPPPSPPSGFSIHRCHRFAVQRGDLPEEVDITLSSMDDCDWQPEMHIWHSAAVSYCRVVDHAPGHHPLPRHAEDPATLLRKNQQEL